MPTPHSSSGLCETTAGGEARPIRHNLLQRQIQRHLGSNGSGIGPEALAGFLEAVEATYRTFDEDRKLVERSLKTRSLELQEANSEMNGLLQSIPDMLFRVDRGGRIIDAKIGSGLDLLVVPRPQAGDNIQETILRSAGSTAGERLHLVFAGRPAPPLEWSIGQPPDRRIYEARFVPGLENEALVIVRNISEQKLAGESLRQTVSLLQSTIESSGDGILVADLKGRLVLWNRRFVQLWGLSESTLAEADDDSALAEVLPQLSDPGGFIRRVREYYADPESEGRDVIELRDGRVFERYSCPQRLEGQAIGRVWSFSDATERLHAEEALRAEEERFRYVALATRDAIYDWNLAAGTIWRSEGAQAIFSAEHLFNMDNTWWEEQIHEDDRHRVKQSLADALLGREVIWSGEYRIRRTDGSYATLLDRGHIVYGPTGQPLRMIGAMTDISERKRLEEQFLQSQKMEAIGQLAGGVAHDFNNLLTVIQGNISMLRMGGLTEGEQRVAVGECFRASQRAANLTRQLLTFSRREKVELKPLNLNDVVSEMTRMIQRLLGEHIQIKTDLAPGAMPVLADAGMLEQVLMNLVVNARDAMPGGGVLQIQTSDETVREIPGTRHPHQRPGRFVHLRVADTGCGIPPELLARIFEPFFTTKDADKGTGLGLATVFGIVQQHQGWIDVESTPGQGTAMHVFLPRLVVPEPAPAVRADSVPCFLGGSESILVVEDEELVRCWIQTLLQRHGYEVLTAGSGRTALDLQRRTGRRFDLLVTDMVMPGGMSGRELGEAMKAAQPDLKVVLCSGYSDEFFGDKAPRRDTLSFLAKPFDTATLLRRIRQLLDTR